MNAPRLKGGATSIAINIGGKMSLGCEHAVQFGRAIEHLGRVGVESDPFVRDEKYLLVGTDPMTRWRGLE